MWYLIFKAAVSAGVIVAAAEIARRKNFAASWLHSLPLISVWPHRLLTAASVKL